MIKYALALFLVSFNVFATYPVYDGPRHSTDIIDNIRELLDFAEQISNQVEQIEQLGRQIEQMDDQLERYGKAADVRFDPDDISINDLENILDEVESILDGELYSKHIEETEELFGVLDKEEHTIEKVEEEEAYDKHERVENEYHAYKEASKSISEKRMIHLEEIHSLTVRLNNANTTEEYNKISKAIESHKAALDGLKAEEERQYRSYMAELERNRNMSEKESTRQNERAKLNNKLFKQGADVLDEPHLVLPEN